MITFFRNHLQARVLGLLLLALLLALVLGVFIQRALISNFAYEMYLSMSQDEAQTVELAIHHALMANDFSMAQETLLSIGKQSQRDSIRLIGRNGTVLASSNPEERGVHLETSSPTCKGCHAAAMKTLDHLLLPATDSGFDLLVVANPVENQVACQSCHTGSDATLGMILTETRLGPLDSWLNRLNKTLIAGAVGLFVLVAGLLGITLQRSVVNPLRAINRGEAGEWVKERDDEIGYAARRMSVLEGTLTKSEAREEIQSRHFKALLSMLASIGDSLSIQEVFQLALVTVKEVTGFSSVAMRYFDRDRQCFRLIAQNGMTPEMCEALHCIPANVGFHAELMVKKRPIYTSDLPHDPRRPSDTPISAGYISLVSVPLLSGDLVLGSMELAIRQVHDWSSDELRWLELVGRSTGNLLHHVELSERLRGMAVLQERSRLAQEIHDGLVQLLGSLRLWAEEAQLALSDQDQQALEAALKKIEATSRDAYASLREEMLGLRHTIVPSSGIIPVLKEYLLRFQRQWEIDTRLVIEGEDGDEISLPISPAAEIQLLRIIQESMTNVRRHAEATLLEVRFKSTTDRLQVEIEDNGKGFSPVQVSRDSLGLRIIRERAASVGGQVEIVSSPGKGTRLRVSLPRQVTRGRVQMDGETA